MSESQDALVLMKQQMNGGMVSVSPEERAFEFIQRKARMYAASDMVPATYKGKIANVIVAMEMAARQNMPVLQIMQSLYVVHGNPSWKAEYVIARVNESGKFKGPIKYQFEGKDKTRSCTAYAVGITDGEKCELTVDWEVVEAEGWAKKAGSKWLTMPDVMFRYRAGAWFARAFCPEVLLGVPVEGEVDDYVEMEQIQQEPESYVPDEIDPPGDEIALDSDAAEEVPPPSVSGTSGDPTPLESSSDAGGEAPAEDDSVEEIETLNAVAIFEIEQAARAAKMKKGQFRDLVLASYGASKTKDLPAVARDDVMARIKEFAEGSV